MAPTLRSVLFLLCLPLSACALYGNAAGLCDNDYCSEGGSPDAVADAAGDTSDAASNHDGPVSIDGGGGDAAQDVEASIVCDSGTAIVCNSACVDPSDPSHCGTCDNACAGPEAGSGFATCHAGSCGIACDGDASTSLDCLGSCVDPLDIQHCGGCNTTCAAPTAGTGAATCTASGGGAPSCGITCMGMTSMACSGACLDPTLPANCGNCNTVCAAPTTGTNTGAATCTASGGGAPSCGIACDPGYHVCGSACLANTDVPSKTTDPCILTEAFGVFVSSTTGSDTTGSGSRAAPYASIGKGVAHAGSMARVYVCNGTYDEAVTVTSAIGIYGGLSCAANVWSYVVGSQADVAAPANDVALTISSVAGLVDIEDMSFTSTAATGQDAAGNGHFSIAGLVSASSDVSLLRCALSAGAGANGVPGSSASNYTGLNAQAGVAPVGMTGGTGGVATCNNGDLSNGGVGGDAKTTSGTGGGTGTSTPATNPIDGAGGGSGTTSCGTSAQSGSNGAARAAGSQASSLGTLAASGWTPTSATAGQPGEPGQGGGGGGALNTVAGGGGGSGGCGGAGGTPGGAGGASIALGSVASTLTLASTTLVTSAGGNGGNGGNGQISQGGGSDGPAVCSGAYGGNGAGGSGGAGGSVGVSVCVVYTGSLPAESSSTCTFGANGMPGTGGTGGAFGTSLVITTGTQGQGAPGGLTATGVSQALLLVP